MQTEQIVALLTAERDRLSLAIDALQHPMKRRGRPASGGVRVAAESASAQTRRPSSRRLSAAGRKAIADAARRRWAAIKASKAQAPSASKPKK